MPLRPNIAGFHLPTFRRLVDGSTPEEDVDAIVADVTVRLADVPEDDVRPVLDHVRQILTGGLRPGGVEKEGSALVNAVIALATTGQQPRWMDCSDWQPGFVDFASRFPAAPSDLDDSAGPGPQMVTLIRWALLQRPVFGRPQGGWWSTYGFLDHDETGRLLEYRRRHPRLDGTDPRMAADFFARLAEVHGTGLDYWFHCS